MKKSLFLYDTRQSGEERASLIEGMSGVCSWKRLRGPGEGEGCLCGVIMVGSLLDSAT